MTWNEPNWCKFCYGAAQQFCLWYEWGPSLWSVCCINQSLAAIEVASVVMFGCVAGYFVHQVYNNNKITTSRAIVKQFVFFSVGGVGGVGW